MVLPVEAIGPVRLALVVTVEAVEAFPDRVAVIVPAAKLPLLSRLTSVLAVSILAAADTVVLFVAMVEAAIPPTKARVRRLP